MNYKHAYHAGNFADVVKHILLRQLFNHLNDKGKPYYALDAYAGRGLYSLVSDEAKKTAEAQTGVQVLLQHVQDIQQGLTEGPTSMPLAVRQFCDELQIAKKAYDKHVYPGSPWWMAQQVATQTENSIRAEAFEAQAAEYDALNYQLYQLPIGIHHRDAFEGIKAVIPPKEKRGIILIDPPYEQEHRDFGRLVDLLVDCHTKWSQGIYALWYPIKNNDAVNLFHKKMKRTGIKKQLVCELNIYPSDLSMGLNGTGMLIINPPWQFDRQAYDIIKYLQPILKAKDAPYMSVEESIRLQWLVGE